MAGVSASWISRSHQVDADKIEAKIGARHHPESSFTSDTPAPCVRRPERYMDWPQLVPDPVRGNEHSHRSHLVRSSFTRSLRRPTAPGTAGNCPGSSPGDRCGCFVSRSLRSPRRQNRATTCRKIPGCCVAGSSWRRGLSEKAGCDNRERARLVGGNLHRVCVVRLHARAALLRAISVEPERNAMVRMDHSDWRQSRVLRW